MRLSEEVYVVGFEEFEAEVQRRHAAAAYKIAHENKIMKTTLQSILMTLVLTVLTGVIYPLAVTGVARVAFPDKANGSLIKTGDTIAGSSLLAQKFEGEQYFWPRPSGADYATVASGATNKGPTAADLAKAIADRRKALGDGAPIDLLTSSGSGLDPDISPEAAHFQVARIAAARKVAPAKVEAIIERHLQGPQLGILGEPRVNVLALNLDLQQLQ